jgi:cytochrome P450
MTITLTPQALADRSAWTRPEAMFEMLGEYRRNEPVVWVEGQGFLPFWLVTRYHDIMEIERRPELFTNRQGPILAEAEPPDETAEEDLRPLPHRDGEDHRVHRAIAQGWFKFGTMQQVERHATELARRSVDELLAGGPECDFAGVVAGRYPLQVILSILGLPEQDYDMMYRFTQIMVWDKDPEEAYRNWQECLAYFDTLRSPSLGWAFTANHAHLVREGIDGFLDAMDLTRCGEVRLADGPRDRELHLPPGKGSIDFSRLFQRLEGAGYTGHYMQAYSSPDDMLNGRETFVGLATAAPGGS